VIGMQCLQVEFVARWQPEIDISYHVLNILLHKFESHAGCAFSKYLQDSVTCIYALYKCL